MRKENIILGGVFVFLLVLAFVYEPIMNWKTNLSRPDNFLSKINFEDVVKININKDGNDITLERQGDKWKIAGTKDFYVKDSDKIFSSYIEEAIDSNFDLASNNGEKKSEFETDNGAHIIFEDNEGEVANFIVGKMTSDFAGSYVSLPDLDETYRVEGNISYALNKDVNSWYDKSIFSADKEKANKIRFQYPNSEFSVEKVNKGNEDSPDYLWQGTLPYTFSVDQDKISEILDLMTNLNALDIPEQTFEGTGLENHSIIVEVSGDDIQNVLMVGGENDDGNYFAKKGSSDNIYLITSAQKQLLETSIRSLR